jgi:hypothetical protein
MMTPVEKVLLGLSFMMAAACFVLMGFFIFRRSILGDIRGVVLYRG